jgi:hypothetical protein
MAVSFLGQERAQRRQRFLQLREGALALAVQALRLFQPDGLEAQRLSGSALRQDGDKPRSRTVSPTCLRCNTPIKRLPNTVVMINETITAIAVRNEMYWNNPDPGI